MKATWALIVLLLASVDWWESRKLEGDDAIYFVQLGIFIGPMTHLSQGRTDLIPRNGNWEVRIPTPGIVEEG
jgi:hypothetical protein